MSVGQCRPRFGSASVEYTHCDNVDPRRTDRPRGIAYHFESSGDPYTNRQGQHASIVTMAEGLPKFICFISRWNIRAPGKIGPQRHGARAGGGHDQPIMNGAGVAF